MSLQFILGNSGSGKTTYMQKWIVEQASEHPTKNYLVVVPEQFTMQTQRALVDMSYHGAIMNIDVLSFDRLAYRIFDELGKTNLTVLEETGKNLVLRKVAQQKEEQLTVFRPNLSKMGYISEVKSLLSELSQYHVTPEILEAYRNSEKASPVLSAKLADIIVMYQGFQEFMEGRYITSEEILSELCKVIDQSNIIRDSVIVFDEFTGFTPIQMMLIRKLLHLSEKIMVGLTIDVKENIYVSKGIQELFDLPKRTISGLCRLCEEEGVSVEEPIKLNAGETLRFKDAPSLYFMEQNLFRTSYKRKLGIIDEIQMATAKNPREEIMAVARQINYLVRTKGYRYKDIAVVTGAVESYSNYITPMFEKYQIPYFLDATKEIMFHPFIEFIRASLDVIESDFDYESVLRYLRCGFCNLTEEEIDLFDNYLLATGIKGRRNWEKRFLRVPRNRADYDIDQMEEIHQKIYQVLGPFADRFQKKKVTVKEKIIALYQLTVDLDIEKQLAQKEAKYLEADQQTKSKEYEQIYRIVMELFEKIVLLLGEECMDIREFREILDAGLDAAKVASIPPGYDSVTIGDIERTRLNQVKVLFFVGVNDGIIPKAGNQGGIISQYERELLAQGEVELAPGTREQVFIQKFYLYLNLTKPSQRLYLSYSRLDSDGKSQRASYLIGVIRKMFPDMQVSDIEDLEKIPDFSTIEAAKDYLVNGEKDEKWYALAKCFMEESEERKAQIAQILSAEYISYQDEPISRIVAQAIYGKKMEGSVTRFEQFAACAYAHFLEYGLKIREREECGFASIDIGNLYHSALEIYSKRLQESKFDWFHIPDEVRDQMAVEAMEQAVSEYQSLSIYATAETRHQVERMSHVMKQTVWALTKQVQKGTFVPTNFEVSFSQAENLESIEFQLSEEERMRLLGRIDRMDLCQEENQLYVKVVDYKSGSTKFDLVKVYQGLQLQLIVYMNAAMELQQKENPGKEVIPGGIFYYHIDDPVIEAQGEMKIEEYKQEVLKALKPDGLVNREERIYRAMDDKFESKSDVIPVSINKDGSLSKTSKVAETFEFQLLQEYVQAKIEDSSRQIFEGKVSVNPYNNGNESSCTYCPYTGICGMDVRIPGYEYRNLNKVDKKDIIDRIQIDLARMKQQKGETK